MHTTINAEVDLLFAPGSEPTHISSPGWVLQTCMHATFNLRFRIVDSDYWYACQPVLSAGGHHGSRDVLEK